MLTITKAKAATQGSWKPGQSGNPKGGKTGYKGPSVTDLCRQWTPDAVKALVMALHHPATRVPAAVAILDRGWGKPLQTVHTQSESTVLHLVAAQAIGEELLSLQTQPPVIEQQAEQRADDTPTE